MHSHAAGALLAADSGPQFEGPSIGEFYPPPIFSIGSFEFTRILGIRVIMLIVLVLLFWLSTRHLHVVPGRWQGFLEWAIDIPRKGIAIDVLGEKDGKRFAPLIVSIFFMVLFFNVTGIIPLFNMPGTALIGTPLVLAVVAYIAFIYAGVKKNPVGFFKNALFPPGVPWPLYIIVAPIEFVSTFIIRPVTLTLRLLMNMVVGHLLLVLCFLATWFFWFTLSSGWIVLGVVTLGFGIAFTFLEILVIVLQAYVFAILTAVYIQLALLDEH